MLDVTTAAKELLRNIDQPQTLRLQPVGAEGQLGFVMGSAHPDDQVVEESGHELLRIADEVSQHYDGHRLDRIDTAEGPKLTIAPPNQPSAVG